MLASLLVSLLSFGWVHAGTLQGTVVRVVDGDTLWVRADAAGNGKSAKPIKLRLQGIDEIGRAHV